GVQQGELSRLFQKGQAVILEGDGRISRLFRSVLDWLGFNEANATNEQSPFKMNLLDLARNHREADLEVGDTVRFVPTSFVHLARKSVVCTGADQSLNAFPNVFYLQDRRVRVPHNILEWSWNLMSEVFRSVLPKHANTLPYAVEVDVLIYPNSLAEIHKLHTL